MRRSQTSSPAPQARMMSLADWESAAPLDELEVASVGIIREACSVRPLPIKVSNRLRSAFEHLYQLLLHSSEGMQKPDRAVLKLQP